MQEATDTLLRSGRRHILAPWQVVGGPTSLLTCMIFFVSGFPALVYQLVWQRSLFILFGVNIESVTVVVAGFMLGLGLGSFAGGKLSQWRPLPLLLMFGGIELATACFGFCSLRLFEAAGEGTLHAPEIVVLVLPLLLLLIPTVLMGATLPILVAHLVLRSREVGVSVGLLYFVNTLGSSAACFVVALWMMRTLGMRDSVYAAACLNVLVGASALALQLCRGDGTAPNAAEGRRIRKEGLPLLPFGVALILCAATGFLSLSYEIVWFRFFAFVSGTSALSFGLVLGAFLAGIALGSFGGSVLCEASGDGETPLRALILALVIGSLAGFVYIPATSWLIASGVSKFVYGSVMLVGIVMVAGLLGCTLSLLSESCIAPDRWAGAKLSYLYLANIAGSVAGSLGTGFVLMDHLGIGAISILLSVTGLGLGLALLLSQTPRRWPDRYLVAACCIGIPVIAISADPLFSRLYDHILFRTAYGGAAHFAFGHVAATVENKHEVINVTTDKVAFGGGMYDGMINVDIIDDRNNLERPFALSFFAPAPREVLIIGLATGAWAQVIANHPQLERLTIVEINPGYLGLISRYPEVASLLKNPKVEIVIDDGRRWLNRHPERKFDAIVQNTTWFFRAHASNLLSEEYLKLNLAHLKKNGIAMYNTTNSDRAARTACVTAPAAMRLSTMMVISNEPLSLDAARWERTLLAYRIDGRKVIDPADPRQRERLAALWADVATLPRADDQRPPAFLESCASILERTTGKRLITDDNAGEEWNYLKFDKVFNE